MARLAATILLLVSFVNAQTGAKLEYVLVNSCIKSIEFTQADCRGDSPETLQCQRLDIHLKPGLHKEDCLNINIIHPGQKPTVVTPAPVLTDKSADAKLLHLRRLVLDPTFIEDVEEKQ